MNTRELGLKGDRAKKYIGLMKQSFDNAREIEKLTEDPDFEAQPLPEQENHEDAFKAFERLRKTMTRKIIAVMLLAIAITAVCGAVPGFMENVCRFYGRG